MGRPQAPGAHRHSQPSTGSFAAEVDILCVVLAFQWRGEEPDDVYAGEASITRHFAHEIAFAFRQTHGELGDDMPQAVNLLLPPDVTDCAA
jgi:hypothetical protein